MRVLHDTVTATVEAKGNAPAQETITLAVRIGTAPAVQVTVTP
jgi:hypothetical protein